MSRLGKNILIILSLLSVSLGLFAQQGNNPFELPGRVIPSEDTLPATSIPAATLSTQNSLEPTTDPATDLAPEETITNQNNPFEIKKPTFSSPKKTTVKPIKKPETAAFQPLSGKFKLWMTILLVTILTVLVNIYKSVLAKVYRSFLNDNFLKMVHRDYGTVTMIPYLILYAFSLILIGTFLFVVLNHYEIAVFSTTILNLFASIGAVFAIFMIKHLVLQIVGSIFPISKEIEQYSFTIIIFGIMVGFFLMPAILLITYAPSNLTITLIYGTFIVISMIYLYRILRSLFIGLKYISLHKFHFFVYLCTIEIAPLLVLIKLVTTT